MSEFDSTGSGEMYVDSRGEPKLRLPTDDGWRDVPVDWKTAKAFGLKRPRCIDGLIRCAKSLGWFVGAVAVGVTGAVWFWMLAAALGLPAPVVIMFALAAFGAVGMVLASPQGETRPRLLAFRRRLSRGRPQRTRRHG